MNSTLSYWEGGQYLYQLVSRWGAVMFYSGKMRGWEIRQYVAFGQETQLVPQIAAPTLKNYMRMWFLSLISICVATVTLWNALFWMKNRADGWSAHAFKSP